MVRPRSDGAWLSAEKSVGLGLAERLEQPVRMAARFDLSRFRNPPLQLAALAATVIRRDPEESRTQQPHPAVEPDQPGPAGDRSGQRAAEDEATAIRGQVRLPTGEPHSP